jgi:Tfp pilus assembly protein PilX
MSKRCTMVVDERGVALPMALIILVVLSMLAMALLTLGSVEPQISSNLSEGARARQLAEAGIEYAFSQLVGQDFGVMVSTASSGSSCPSGTVCRILATSQPLPGLTSTQGTFTVSIRNNYLTSDNQLTGLTSEATSSTTTDVDGVLIVTSTGAYGTARRRVTAVVQRGVLNLRGALNLPGVQTDTFTNTPCPTTPCPPNPLKNYSIDGRDWKRADSTTPTGTYGNQFGVVTYTGTESGTGLTYEANAEAGFSDTYRRDYVQGKDQTSPTSATTGLNTIAADSSAGALSPTVVADFLANLAANPGTQVLNSTAACQFAASGGLHTKPEGLQMSTTTTANVVRVRNNCSGASGVDQTINLGTPTSPAMIYVKGDYDPTSNFVGMAVDGGNPVQGYGILVMEEADLSFFQNSNFRWDGIVLVTGRNVGVGFRANSNTEIRGALIANETNGAEVGGYFEFLNQSNSMVIRYSKEDIDLALRGLYNMRITTYREDG